jgi:hypothetical protein
MTDRPLLGRLTRRAFWVIIVSLPGSHRLIG